MKEEKGVLPVAKKRGYDKIKLMQLWCFHGLNHFDAARCVHVALGHTLACISCHGTMGSPLSAHWQQCKEDLDLPENFVKYLLS